MPKLKASVKCCATFSGPYGTVMLSNIRKDDMLLAVDIFDSLVQSDWSTLFECISSANARGILAMCHIERDTGASRITQHRLPRKRPQKRPLDISNLAKVLMDPDDE